MFAPTTVCWASGIILGFFTPRGMTPHAKHSQTTLLLCFIIFALAEETKLSKLLSQSGLYTVIVLNTVVLFLRELTHTAMYCAFTSCNILHVQGSSRLFVDVTYRKLTTECKVNVSHTCTSEIECHVAFP